MTKNTLPEWARDTLRPACPACGNYLLPCTVTPTGVHPATKEEAYAHLHQAHA
jgi:hypothetical protein